jgi:hypothetical protein
MKEDRKERTACQEVTEATPEKMEPNQGQKEATVEQQEIPNQEFAIHSLRACRNEESMAVSAEKMEPIDHAIAILEAMKAVDLKANP